MRKKLKSYHTAYKIIDAEEKANVMTHLIGIVLVIVTGPFLIFQADNLYFKIGTVIFIVGLGFTYLSSTIYHLMHIEDLKNKWQLIDHISIFILISSSYTVYILKFYNTFNGHLFLGLHWFISFAGILFKYITRDKYELVFLCLYILQGWLVVFIFQEITQDMNVVVYQGLIFGAVFYMVGVIFYVWNKLKWNHAIWHIFVLLGSISHYVSLWHANSNIGT